jgi:hypothetical protein
MYKYKYADLNCDYCLYCKRCKFSICPYILEFLDDLKEDITFIAAVENAEMCDNPHKQTLIKLKNFSKEVNNG